MNIPPLSIEKLFSSLCESLQLEWVAGHAGGEKRLHPDLYPWGGAAAVNSLNPVNPCDVQVIGIAEMAYLKQLSAIERAESAQHFFHTAKVIIVADALIIPPALRAGADARGIPLLGSPLPDQEVISHLRFFLNEAMAERQTVHGVFMEVLSSGVLITGESHIGKSELALELITRGHRLIADDAPKFARIRPDTLQGSCPSLLQDLLEVRGLGILDIRAMYGDNAIKPMKNLSLIISLQAQPPPIEDDSDRLHGMHSEAVILNIGIPVIIIPLAPSRNLAVLVEAATRNHLLRRSGQDAAEIFIQRQLHQLEHQKP